MDFFSKIGNKVSSVANSAASKAKDFADTTSINRQINADEGRINTLYSEIGRIYYTKNINNPTDEFAAAFNEIASLKVKIEEAKAQLQSLKKTKTCPHCGNEMPNEVAFCANCGTKVETPVTQAPQTEQSATKTCPGCGKVEASTVSFCSGCGCKLN